MSPQHLQVLDANKREMFDAMRAYQESERGHKTDAMAMLGALLAATGAIFGALALTDKPVPHVGLLSAMTAAAATLGAWLVVSTTNSKIDSDHTIYKNFGAEYMRTCEAMGLYEPDPCLTPYPRSIKVARNIGEGKGYEHTKRILNSIGFTLSALSWLAFVFVALAVCTHSSNCRSAQPVALPSSAASAPSP